VKINKSWIISNVLFFLLYFLALSILWAINISPFTKTSSQILITIALGVFASACAGAFAYDTSKGKAYYQLIDIHMSKFEVTLYSNRVIIVHDNHAWTFSYKRDKIFKSDKIKSLHWYDIKKNFLGWELVPYEGDI